MLCTTKSINSASETNYNISSFPFRTSKIKKLSSHFGRSKNVSPTAAKKLPQQFASKKKYIDGIHLHGQTREFPDLFGQEKRQDNNDGLKCHGMLSNTGFHPARVYWCCPPAITTQTSQVMVPYLIPKLDEVLPASPVTTLFLATYLTQGS